MRTVKGSLSLLLLCERSLCVRSVKNDVGSMTQDPRIERRDLQIPPGSSEFSEGVSEKIETP
ncbi:hypothetical protein AOLI_G00013550 [Acnodon oligacanthus]